MLRHRSTKSLHELRAKASSGAPSNTALTRARARKPAGARGRLSAGMRGLSVPEEVASDIVPVAPVRAPFGSRVAMPRMTVAASGVEHAGGGGGRTGDERQRRHKGEPNRQRCTNQGCIPQLKMQPNRVRALGVGIRFSGLPAADPISTGSSFVLPFGTRSRARRDDMAARPFASPVPTKCQLCLRS